MRQIRSVLPGLAFAFCISPCAGLAQTSEIAVQTQASSGDIQSWLESGDPRLMAWGAYFSARNGDPSGDATMVEILDRWAEAGKKREELTGTEQDAFTAILDALIQHNRALSPETLAVLAEKFPAQTAILAARQSPDEAMPLLQSWYAERGSEKQPALARIAAMMLAKSPPRGFAAGVLKESKETVEVSVVDPGTGVGGGVGGGLYSLDGPMRQGWPPILQYNIVENPQEGNDPLLIEAGGDRITYRRTDKAGGSFIGVRSLNDETRQHLLLEMLGGDRSALQWKTQQQISIEWQGPANFLSEVLGIVDEEESRLRDTVEALYEDGLLSPEEASKVRPALLVNVVDYRSVKDSSIPAFESRDPRTTVATTLVLRVD